MSNKQNFILCILGLVVLLVFIVGGVCVMSLKLAENVLMSPAATTTFSVEGEIVIKTDNAVITINKLSGSLNSKIVDLILLAVND